MVPQLTVIVLYALSLPAVSRAHSLPIFSNGLSSSSLMSISLNAMDVPFSRGWIGRV